MVLCSLLALGACDGSDGDDGAGGAPSGGGSGGTDGSGGSPTNDGGTGGSAGGLGGLGGSGGLPEGRVPGTEHYDCSKPSGSIPALALLPVGGTYSRPVLVTHAPGDTSHLFVVEQKGLIWRVTKTGSGASATYTKAATPFLDIDDETLSWGDGVAGNQDERGLLGLAFHPDYAENGLFYVHHSAIGDGGGVLPGDTIIAEYQVNASGDAANEATRRRVLRVLQTNTNNNGGTITFGADGYLYIALGDGGGSADPSSNGQGVDELLGNILRIDPTGDEADEYISPADNLKQDVAGALPEIWDIGLRNPYRMNFDACRGDLYIGDVGEAKFEEINIEKAGDGRKNYGWRIAEGSECSVNGCSLAGLTAPTTTLPSSSSSIVGGSVYRGSEIPGLRGVYVYGKTSVGQVFTLTFDGDGIDTPLNRTNDVNPDTGSGRYVITSIQNAGDGEIFFTDMGDGEAGTGHLLKLVAE